MESYPGVDELKKLRVVDLKERLSKLGKSTSGLKADLVDRLYNVLREESQGGEQDQEQEELGSYNEQQCIDNTQPPVVEVVIDTAQFGGMDQVHGHHDPYSQVENQMMPQYTGGHIINVSNSDVGSIVHDQQQHSFNVQQDEYSPPVDLSMPPVQQIQLQQPLMFVEMQPMRQMEQQQQHMAHSPLIGHSRMVIPSSPVAQQQHSPVAMLQSSPPMVSHHSPIYIHSSPTVDQHSTMILSPHSPLVLTSPSVHQVVLQSSPSEVHHSPMFVQSPGSDHMVQMVASSSSPSMHHQAQMFGVEHSVEQQQQQQQQQHEAMMSPPPTTQQITIFTSPQHQIEQHSPMVVQTHQPQPMIESTHFSDESHRSQVEAHQQQMLEHSEVPPPMSPNIQVYQVPLQQQTPPSAILLSPPTTDQVSIAVPLTPSSVIPLETSVQPQIVVPSNVAVEGQMWAQPVTMTQSVVYEPIPSAMEVPAVVTTQTPPHISLSSPPPSVQNLGPPSPSVGRASQPPSLMSLDVAKPAVLEDNGKNENGEVHLPQALEKALAFKSERAHELGVDPDIIQNQPEAAEERVKEVEEEVAVEIEPVIEKVLSPAIPKSMEPKPSKNKRRKMKKKKRAKHRRDAAENALQMDVSMNEETGEAEDVEVQYVQDSLDLNPSDPMYGHFMKIFEAFKLTDPETAKREAEEAAARAKAEAKKEPDLRKKPKDADEEPELDIKAEEVPKLSKRKMKMLNQLSIAELKQHVNRPDVVEMHDVTAKDPKLLVILKSTRNTVSVPRHWCFKRKYLQGKRGIEKPPFNLPDFIKKTGIMEMRQALQEKEDQKTMKAKMRERVRPKMGKIDIDYQKLHDAFFKWQTKPRMTIHGDLYYEGKELETRLREKKPGDLSTDLRNALGMPTGPNSHKVPPPWLIAMQRYGPPPSYPNLKIPGLNSPIPDNCSFGYHAGGWGKPPVDEMGKPLYGDVFGTAGGEYNQPMMEEEIDRTLWGELESESESESEEEEEEEEEAEGDTMEQEDIDRSGLATPSDGGLITPSGISSIPAGMETPDMIELRKRKIESEMESVDTPSLYTILPEKRADRLGAAMMGSTHIYDITAAMPGRVRPAGMGGGAEGGVEVALDPSELDMDSAAMAARYEQTLREQQNQLEKEDLSDMVAEHTAKQKNKRKRAAGQQDSGRATKKYKDFKF